QPIRLDASGADEGGVMRRAGALVIHPMNEHLLLEHMMTSARFATRNRQGKWVQAAPPLELAKHYAARGTWRLRVLRGIIEAPTMRPDGSILSEPGYDPATGIYLDTGGVVFPAIPDRP